MPPTRRTDLGRLARPRGRLTNVLAVALVLLSLACNSHVPPGTTKLHAPRSAPAAAVAAGQPWLTSRTVARASGRHGAVASAEASASEVGLAILQRGGNAVDAAVALGFALGVTHPSAANIGGGGFMIVRLADGRRAAIDYREVAPRAATPDMFLDEQHNVPANSEFGPRARGIPGTVAGLALAHRKFGSLPWPELLAPAIRLARDGSVLDEPHAAELRRAVERVEAYAAVLSTANGTNVPKAERRALLAALEATSRAFSRPDGSAYTAGDSWQQPALARTLEIIATRGAEAFYRGPLASELADKVRAMGGIWSTDDLRDYRVEEREPIVFDYHGHEIITMPPPSSGGILLQQILIGADGHKLQELAWASPQRIHLYVEILRRAFADRNQLLGDPAFVDIPVGRLTDARYIAARMASIDPAHATPSSRVQAGTPVAEPIHTTHFSVVDDGGMAVSNTYTLNTDFGALVQIPETGVTLNNEMDDFSMKPGTANAFGLVQGRANAIAPNKRMLSSMSPTIVVKDGKLRAVLGSPGGPTIITTVAQLLLLLIDYDTPLHDAIAAPRIHHQWLPDEIGLEAGLPSATEQALRSLGHTLAPRALIGHAHCIEVVPGSGMLHATADVGRGGGGASAY